MKKKHMDYCMLAIAGIGLFLLLKQTGTIQGLGQHRGRQRKRRHRMPRLTCPGSGSPLSCCQVPPQRCPVDFEVMTSPATFGECGGCNYCCGY